MMKNGLSFRSKWNWLSLRSFSFCCSLYCNVAIMLCDSKRTHIVHVRFYCLVKNPFSVAPISICFFLLFFVALVCKGSILSFRFTFFASYFIIYVHISTEKYSKKIEIDDNSLMSFFAIRFVCVECRVAPSMRRHIQFMPSTIFIFYEFFNRISMAQQLHRRHAVNSYFKRRRIGISFLYHFLSHKYPLTPFDRNNSLSNSINWKINTKRMRKNRTIFCHFTFDE